MDTIQLFVEEVLRLEEATALEIFDSVYKDKKPISADSYLKILENDPTATVGIGIDTENTLENSKKGKFTDWIVKQYFKAPDKARFVSEDAAGIKDALNLYIKATKNKEGIAKLAQAIAEAGLKINNPSDINAFDRQALLTAVAPLRAEVSLGVKEEKQVKVLMDDAYWQVVIPLTHAASRKYGTDTHWCTATETGTYFQHYTKDGPLVIIKSKKLEAKHDKRLNYKWQYHQPSNQFKNQADRGVGYFSFVDQFLTSQDPAEIESTKKLIDTLISVYPADSAKWDYTRVLDKMKYDYNAVNTALAQASSPLSAKVKSGRTEQGEEVSILTYAVHAKNLDLLNDILNLEDVVWPTSSLTNVLGVALRQSDSVMFGNILRDIKDKPMALMAEVKGRGITLMAETMIKDAYWMNEALQSLADERERKQVLLLSNYYGTPFMQAIVRGGKAAEDNLIECAELILSVFPIKKMQEGLTYTRPTIDNYFLISTAPRYRSEKPETAISLAEGAGMFKLVGYLKKLSGLQVENIIKLSSEQVMRAYLKDKQYVNNPAAEITRIYRWSDDEKRPIPLPSFLGFAVLVSSFAAKSNTKMLKDYFNYIETNHKEVYLKNTEETNSQKVALRGYLTSLIDKDSDDDLSTDPMIMEIITSGFIENLGLTKKTFLTQGLFATSSSAGSILAKLSEKQLDPNCLIAIFFKKLGLTVDAVWKVIFKRAIERDWRDRSRSGSGYNLDDILEDSLYFLVRDEYHTWGTNKDYVRKIDYKRLQDIVFSVIETNDQVDTFVKVLKNYMKNNSSNISTDAKESLATKGKAWKKAHPR